MQSHHPVPASVLSSIVVCTLFSLLTGCATEPPTLGEQLVQQGQTQVDLGNQWTKGQELVSNGNKLIQKGNDKIRNGKEQMADGESDVDQGERDVKEGQKLVKEVEKLRGINPASSTSSP